MAIVIENLHKNYLQGNEVIEAVRGVNLVINPGEFIVLIGPSGGGKSTFLSLVGGMDRPTSGSIHFDEFALETATEEQLTHFRARKVGFVFQFYNLLTSLNALENAMLPLIARGESSDSARKKALAVLEQLEIGHRQKHLPSQLSGGEQQRVAIARAIIGEPELIIADEPTGDLDSTTAEEIVHLMHRLNKEKGITFLVATHNLALCERADRNFEMKDGAIHEKHNGTLR